MTGIIVFATCQILASTYACWRGGAPERVVALALLAALLATMLAPLQSTFTYAGINVPVFQIDLLLLLVLTAIALLADRFWPMWIASLQLVTIAAHGVRVYDAGIVPTAYWAITSRIAYPMLLLLVIATLRQHARALAGDAGHGWTIQRWRDRSGADGRTARGPNA